MKLLQTSLYILLSLFCGSFGWADDRPNVVVILVDDLGFSDIGCYGGEIETPRLDELAEGGVKYANFYSSGRCCPSRAALLTGLYPHESGIGYMKNDKGEEFPGYRGFLLRNNMTIAEVLQEAGYATMITGKWHVGGSNFRDKETWPLQRGFEKFYGYLRGGVSPYSYGSILLGNEKVDKDHPSATDRPYYTTDAFADYAIQFINEERENQDRPFFLYWADNTPHYPLHAPEEEVEKYVETYVPGWDVIRAGRLERQKSTGLMAEDMKLSQLPENIPAWKDLPADKLQGLSMCMTYYAAMVDRFDQNVGKLVDALKANGQYENTLIMFLSDNGGSEAGGLYGGADNSLSRERWLASPGGESSYGIGWGAASNTPFREHKGKSHEGGVATPFIAHWPAGIPATPEWYRENGAITDIAPTIYELAGAEYPAEYKSEPILALRGVSLVPSFEGKSLHREAPLLFQHARNGALIDGEMKLVGKGNVKSSGVSDDEWELYNLAEDPAEENNLAEKMPELKNAMAKTWSELARETKIYPKP